MKNFFVITNVSKDKDYKVTNQITDYILSKGCKCSSSPFTSAWLDNDGFHYTDDQMVPEDAEIVLVIGGDGTLIHAAKDLISLNKPILGINFGTLGYLADVELKDYEAAIDALISNEFTVENRMLVTGSVIRDGKKVYSDIALNDIVISRTGTLAVIDFGISVDGEFLNKYHADGVIISTPTGSTGYNLSAGGPLAHPTAEIVIVTPICAHTLNSRSIVFSAASEIEIEMLVDSKKTRVRKIVAFDADNEYLVLPGDIIQIKKAKEFIKIVKINETSFIETVGKKMR